MSSTPPPAPGPAPTGRDPHPATSSVRLALPSEAAAVAQVQRRAWAEDPDLAALLEGLDAEEMTRAWWRAIAQPPLAELRVLVATEPTAQGSTICGFVALGPSDDDDAEAHDGQVGEFLVDPRWRRRGHGSRLLNAAVDTLRADGFTRAVWWVRSTDDALRTFLVESGWGPDGAHRESGTEDGRARVKEIRLHTLVADPRPETTPDEPDATPSDEQAR